MSEKKTGSPRFKLNTEDLMEVVKNALLVGVAAILTFVVDNIGKIEMGESLLIVLPMITLGLNTAIRWIKDYTGFGDTEEDQPE